MLRKYLPLAIAAVFLILLLVIFNLTVQLRQAKQDVAEAREMELESKRYEVQLMNITMYAPLSPGAGRWLNKIEHCSFVTQQGRKLIGSVFAFTDKPDCAGQLTYIF